jgi:hypothetical protein
MATVIGITTIQDAESIKSTEQWLTSGSPPGTTVHVFCHNSWLVSHLPSYDVLVVHPFCVTQEQKRDIIKTYGILPKTILILDDDEDRAMARNLVGDSPLMILHNPVMVGPTGREDMTMYYLLHQLLA